MYRPWPLSRIPGGQDLIFQGLHDLGVFLDDVIVTAQMQQAVNEQQADLLLERGAELMGLTFGHIGRDDDVPKLVDKPAGTISESSSSTPSHSKDNTSVGPSFPRYCSLRRAISPSVTKLKDTSVFWGFS